MKYTFINSRKMLAIAVLVTVAGLLSGCKKNFLDREPQGQYTLETYPYPSGSGPYDTYLFGAYSELRAYNVHSQFFIAATSIRSDDADKGSTPADGGANVISMDNFPVLPDNGYTNGLWTGYYTMVNRCNIAIDQVRHNAAIEATPAVKAQSEAEARFLRAYAYFNLVRFFGRVPLVDSVFTDAASQSNVPQSPPAVIYNFIENDLQFAAANLPLSWDAQFVGRATKGAANGLLAKVYLTQQKWAQAMTTAGMVINSGVYSLHPSYDILFREQGENSQESVFEVQATANATQQTAFGVQYASIQGVRGAGQWNLGWGWNTPSEQLASVYEPGDPRRGRTILFTSTATTPGITIYGETTPQGLPNPRYNHKVYTNPQIRSSVNSQAGYWFNIRLLRYADVLLMYAEAANEVGGTANTTEALAKLEMVRARARAGNNAILPPVTTTNQGQLRDAIRHERRVELAMEHDRFWDIVRWGIAQQVLHAAGKTNFNQNRDVLLPIPQVQIDLSRGVLTQNPGY
ncbi:RagB/SusD family nutrient uptake outer membrane protein [Aridibaculum aurantiacum]|uniref:RagB/SusD family nutrient uptake outer membrane protein n=1 Tax=Aridibaculum aurantiacum TaxID=2810307 RepID=UPI001A97B35C|nr:RagB/SusD family nutrient uptake outer membrane protein [Aridibaculum aurantiacum]